jgi:antitoxin component HigA of HigAB toxin-antitoxin module
MEIKPILTAQDYTDALQAIEAIFDAQPGTPDSDRLEVLVTLVEAYEARHYVIPLPDPIGAIEYHFADKCSERLVCLGRLRIGGLIYFYPHKTRLARPLSASPV